MDKIVCLDAGHGMNTSGKQTPPYDDGSVIKEAEQNYPIMFKVAEKLTEQGIEVVMTNVNKQFDMSLESRVAIANASNADLFYSFHKNAGPSYEWSNARGTEHLIIAKGGNAEKAANIINRNVIVSSGDKNRGVKVQNVYVLRKTNMPAVLGELGFMTNKYDASDMKNEQAQEVYATAIAKGICEFLGVEYEIEEPVDECDCVDEAWKLNLITVYERMSAEMADFKALIDSM